MSHNHPRGLLRVGMPPNVSAPVLDRNPGFTPIAGDCSSLAFGRVVALADTKDDAARLVVCWNECEQYGIPSKVAAERDNAIKACDLAADTASQLRAQRDALLEALILARKNLAREIGVPVEECIGSHFAVYNAAIAKAGAA